MSTTVAAQGTASTKFNLATFNVTLSEEANTVPLAKAQLSEHVTMLNDSLTELKTRLDLKFVKNSLRISSSTAENWQYVRKDGLNEREMQGYIITYNLSFSIDDLDKVSKVYDSLTNLPEVRVAAPAFSLKNKDSLNKKALKAAWKKVEERFAMECDTLGLKKDDFAIGNWETSYSDSQRSDRVAGKTLGGASGAPGASRMMAHAYSLSADAEGAVGGAADADPVVEFTVGQATVTVNLEVGYVRSRSLLADSSLLNELSQSKAA
jgi:hypothetical protein